jgi:SAM-dependent methyltransferase
MAEFHKGDAMALPFPARRFDVAIMALVIFFVPDPAKGVAEMVRVVAPGGKVARMRDALPGSIIVAAALPVAVKGGAVVKFAIVAALVVTVIRRNDFIAVITGMAVAALARAIGICRVAGSGNTPAFGPNHARFGASPRTKMICHSVVVKTLVNRSELVFSSS